MPPTIDDLQEMLSAQTEEQKKRKKPKRPAEKAAGRAVDDNEWDTASEPVQIIGSN